MAHPFLSDEWLDAIEALRSEYDGRLPDPPVAAKVNVTVAGTPHHPEDLALHVDTTGGYPLLLRGHRDDAEVTIATEYAVAVDIVVARDPQKVMQAFLQGRILVRGDLAALMGPLQRVDPSQVDPVAGEFVQRVIELTELPDDTP